jgi:hypothetical protein
MDKATRDNIKRNLFPAALPSVEPWDEFRWHTGQGGQCDADKEHSSQALAIDVFGTLSLIESRHRLLNELLRSHGLQSSGQWTIELEWLVPKILLGERRKTQIDAVARSRDCLIFMECKFSETEAGRCSQPEPLYKGAHKGLRQCNGNFEYQVNPVSGKAAWCSLTAKSIKYWEHIPKLFDISPTEIYKPCPFADYKYQWMRNVVACWAESMAHGLRPVFLVVYADTPGIRQLPTARFLRSDSWASFKSWIRPNSVFVWEVGYIDLLNTALRVSGEDAATLLELRNWVEAKIRKVAAGN